MRLRPRLRAAAASYPQQNVPLPSQGQASPDHDGAGEPNLHPQAFDSAAQICGLGVARTFQISRLFAEMTVLENLVAVARGRDDRAAIALALELLDFLEIPDIADRWGAELSYGQRKLLELAYVLVADPAIILLDEPAGGVNLSLVNNIADRIRELNAAGKTFLIVEHNMEFVMGLCDQVTVLDSGTVVASGPPGIVRTDRRVLDAYLGEDIEDDADRGEGA